MSAIQILLNDLAGQSWPAPAYAGDPFLLQVDEDIVIGLHEDESASLVHLCSRPGYLRPAGWEEDPSMQHGWSTSTSDEDTEPGVVRSLRIEKPDGRVQLIESWPRAALDKILLSERIAYFTELTRYWQRLLQGSFASCNAAAVDDYASLHAQQLMNWR
jgi:hypothetical protein